MHYYPSAVLVLSWTFWLWETYLDYRQYRVYQTVKEVPIELKGKIEEETFKKAKAYSIEKARFGFISSLLSQIQSTVTIYYYLMPYFWNLSEKIMIDSFGMSLTKSIEWEIFQSLLFTLLTSFASTLVNLPLSIYNTFIIEERHGFNKQTATFYAWDKFKMFIVSFFISAPVVATMIYIVRNGGPYFFLYLWVFCFFVVILIIFFQGEIAALFDKFTPLPPGELRDKIEKLASEINFPLTNIYIVEGSKRSSHSNAYQSGVFNKKRVVIYDTLLKGHLDIEGQEKTEDGVARDKKDERKQNMELDEIMAVLCHELGHWHCGHLIRHLTFMEINYFLMFVIFSRFYNDPIMYSAFGFKDMPVIIGLALLMMILTPYNEMISFIGTLMSRTFEYQADAYAKSKGYAERLKTALVKLNIDNLGFPVHDELYSKFNHSHPTLTQRLKALGKNE